MHQVFISYAKADYKDEYDNVLADSIVTEVKQTLTDAKIDFWIDEEGLSSGVEFASMIAHAIVNCDALIFISTAASNRSKWTARELALANEHGKPIIPLKCDDAPYSLKFAMYLATVQYIDCRHDRKKALRMLVRDINDVFAGTYDPEKPLSREEEGFSAVGKQHSILSGISTIAASSFLFYFGIMVLTDPHIPTSVHSAMQFIATLAYLLVSFMLMLAGYGAWQLFRANKMGYWLLSLSFPAVLVAAQDMNDYWYWVVSYGCVMVLLAVGLLEKKDGVSFTDKIRYQRFDVRHHWGLILLLALFCVYAVMMLRF